MTEHEMLMRIREISQKAQRMPHHHGYVPIETRPPKGYELRDEWEPEAPEGYELHDAAGGYDDQ